MHVPPEAYFIITYPVGFVFSIFVHEIGHALAALMVGWRVHVISVMRIAYAPRRRAFHPAVLGGSGDLAGYVFATPPVGAKWQGGSGLLFYSGGTLANFVVGGVCGVWAGALREGSFAEALLAGLAIVSFIFGGCNLIPQTLASGNRTDGAKILDVFRGRSDQLINRAVWLYAYHVDGVDRQFWDAGLVDQIKADMATPGHEPQIEAVLLNSALMLGDVEAARSIMERLQSTALALSDDMRITYALLIAMVDKDAQRALGILGQVSNKKSLESFQYLRAAAVAYHLAGDSSRAIAAVREIRKMRSLQEWLDADDARLLDEIEGTVTRSTLAS